MSTTSPLQRGPSTRDARPPIRAKTAQPRDSADPYRNVLVVNGSSYSLWWWLVLSLHSITAVFVLCAGFVHLALSHPVVHANTPSLQLSISLKRVSGLSYLLIALLHVQAVWMLLRHSIRARELTMRPTMGTGQTQRSLTTLDIVEAPSMYRRLLAAIHVMFGAAGAFGINGRFFNLAVVTRELVEVAMQTYQLWSLSHSVSRVWINDLAVFTVVLNCMSIPVVHVAFHKRERTRRLMHLVVDMYLDFVCAVVIPVCVMTPYLLMFDWGIGSFPLSALGDEVWLTNAIAEGLQVLITSYTDLFASLLPQYSIYACLRILKRLIVRRKVGSTKLRIAHRPRVVVPLVSAESDLTTQSHSTKNTKERRGVQVVGVTVGLWGLGVFILHMTAKLNSNQDPMCRLHLRPWLANQVACSVLIINCSALNITGTREEMANVLDRFERQVLSRVTLANCVELTVPPEIIPFVHLSGITIHNSMLVSWAMDAAVRTSTHPRLDSLTFSASQISEIPPGIYHRGLPAMFTVSFVNCSLAQLPEDIGDVWGHGALRFLGFQGTRLSSIPESLGAIPLTRLWLTDSLIEVLPDDLLSRFQLASLKLSRNPLITLPPTIGDVSSLRELLVEDTKVSNIPVWVFSWLESRRQAKGTTRVSFAGSPVCESGGLLAAGVAGFPSICENKE